MDFDGMATSEMLWHIEYLPVLLTFTDKITYDGQKYLAMGAKKWGCGCTEGLSLVPK